jgi:hypothetical protein
MSGDGDGAAATHYIEIFATRLRERIIGRRDMNRRTLRLAPGLIGTQHRIEGLDLALMDLDMICREFGVSVSIKK